MNGSNGIPHEFLCPISHEIMEDPVMLVETETTFDRKSISEWFQRGHLTCPMTGATISSTSLLGNRPLREAIARWREEHGDSVAATPQRRVAPPVTLPQPSKPNEKPKENHIGWSFASLFSFSKPQKRSCAPMAVATRMTNAVRKGDIKALRALLEEGTWDVNAFDDSGRSPLHWAAMFGDVAIAEELLNNDACVDFADRSSLTPLHFAAQFDQHDVANLLIARDADVNAQTANHYTPLHKAAYWGRTQMIQILLKSGAKQNIRNNQGRRAIDVARESPKPGAKSCFDILKSQMY
ncbi:hypothetical protein BSKO_03698 [Bryopsis sp. KO-2023]|nr:hypothetical protein BSKO_03698 [Bryopsis sp. KO-2023]